MAASSEDFSGVKIVFDKPGGYTTGDPMKVSLTGSAVLVKPTRPLLTTWPVVDPVTGATGTVTGTVPFTEIDTDSVKGASAPTDDAGHTYVQDPSGITATTTA